MFETPLTVVGHIVNDLQRRKVGDQEVIKFRVASNSRRRTADGGWEPGNSLFVTVNCWGRLVAGVGAALGKGAPVIVTGHVYTSEYEDRDGNRRSSTGDAGHRRWGRTCRGCSCGSRSQAIPGRRRSKIPATDGHAERPAQAPAARCDDASDAPAATAPLPLSA